MANASGHSMALLGMLRNVLDEIGVIGDFEVEPSTSVHTRLPFVFCFAVFLYSKRRMVQIAEKACLFVKSLADRGMNILEGVQSSLRIMRASSPAFGFSFCCPRLLDVCFDLGSHSFSGIEWAVHAAGFDVFVGPG